MNPIKKPLLLSLALLPLTPVWVALCLCVWFLNSDLGIGFDVTSRFDFLVGNFHLVLRPIAVGSLVVGTMFYLVLAFVLFTGRAIGFSDKSFGIFSVGVTLFTLTAFAYFIVSKISQSAPPEQPDFATPVIAAMVTGVAFNSLLTLFGGFRGRVVDTGASGTPSIS